MGHERRTRRDDHRLSGRPRRTSHRTAVTVLAVVAVLLALPVGAVADGHELTGVVYSIDAAPDGSFIVTENTTLKEVRRGEVSLVADLPTAENEEGGQFGGPGVAPVNGVAAIGRGNFFVTAGGLDAAEGAGLWRVSRGDARLVADIETFARATDADTTEGFQWKDNLCEQVDGWTAGPQSNPYQLTALSGGEVLIADAAGNSLLHARTDGEIDWVAVFPPPYDENGDWLVQHDLEAGDELWDGTVLEDDLTCYVQPVPTAVDVGPDGDYYVAELNGTPPDPFVDASDIVGTARVWRIDAGARNVTCPSAECEVVFEGLTSVVDAEFGPDGRLYVVEMDANGWFAAVVLGDFAGGTVKACDLDTEACETIEDGIATPSSLTFDKHGDLWIVESMFFQPQIRPVELD